MTEAQQKWVPPPEGTPCWIEIPAVDVDAAKKFYSSIFPNWKFREHTAKGVAPLSFYEGSNLGGGISKVGPECKKNQQDMGVGSTVYYMVDDIETTARRIEKAGGKAIGEKTAESDHGNYQYFSDIEGNRFGIYEIQKK